MKITVFILTLTYYLYYLLASGIGFIELHVCLLNYQLYSNVKKHAADHARDFSKDAISTTGT